MPLTREKKIFCITTYLETNVQAKSEVDSKMS